MISPQSCGVCVEGTLRPISWLISLALLLTHVEGGGVVMEGGYSIDPVHYGQLDDYRGGGTFPEPMFLVNSHGWVRPRKKI